jgi:hypothetical protein
MASTSIIAASSPQRPRCWKATFTSTRAAICFMARTTTGRGEASSAAVTAGGHGCIRHIGRHHAGRSWSFTATSTAGTSRTYVATPRIGNTFRNNLGKEACKILLASSGATSHTFYLDLYAAAAFISGSDR